MIYRSKSRSRKCSSTTAKRIQQYGSLAVSSNQCAIHGHTQSR